LSNDLTTRQYRCYEPPQSAQIAAEAQATYRSSENQTTQPVNSK
jgi:hypothetical protein